MHTSSDARRTERHCTSERKIDTAATSATVGAGWERSARRRSAHIQRSSPAMWVSGWITSGTVRASRLGSPGVSMFENW